MIGLVLTLVLAVQTASGSPGQDPIRVVPGAQPETRTMYRPAKAGERRVEGLLRRIECPQGRPVTFTLTLPDKTPAKYTAPSLASVEYIAHTPTFRGPVSCGGRTPPDRVYLTLAAANKRVIAIEFLPPE